MIVAEEKRVLFAKDIRLNMVAMRFRLDAD